MYKSRFTLAALALCLGLLASPAHAVLTLQLQVGAGPITTISDNGGGDLANLVNDKIIASGSIGAVDYDATGADKTALAIFNSLALNSLDVKSGLATTFTIRLSDTGFTSPTGLASLREQLSVTNIVGDVTVSYTGYFCNGNSLFCTTNAAPTLTTSSDVAGLEANSALYNFTSPYTLTEVVTITFGSAGRAQAQFTSNLTPTQVPEPASVAMLGGVLLLSFGAIRRKMARR